MKILRLLLALCAVSADAQVEKILLPIAFRPSVEVHGTYGSVWRGEVWMHNTATHTVHLSNIECVVTNCTAPYPAGYLGLVDDPLDNVADRGILLVPQKSDIPSLRFSNRTFEVTRHAQPQGIEIPVVFEEQFLSTTTELLAVPVGAAVRSTLRIYDVQRVDGTTLRVDILNTAGQTVATTLLTTAYPAGEHPADHLRPGFAVVPDVSQVFPAANALDRFHIRITPVTPGTKYWAMVSVTDNDTQQVLLITPH